MFFERLGKTVVRHYKKIIIAWLIILMISIPAIINVSDVIAYQETEMVEGSTESLIAQEIIDEQFPISIANSTLMIVIESVNVTSPQVRDFCILLENEFDQNEDLRYLEDFTSIYTVYEELIYYTVSEMGPMIHETEAQTNMTVFLLYGIPSIYLNNWIYYTNRSLNATERDAEAYLLTVASLDLFLVGMDNLTKQMSYQYYNEFTQAWNSTDTNATLVANPPARAETAIQITAPQYIDSLPYPDEQKELMFAILSTFDLASFSNESLIHYFALSSIGSFTQINDLEFLEQVYGLGPEYAPANVSSFADQIVTSGTLETYPVQISSDYLTGFISPDNDIMLIIVSFSKETSYAEEGVGKPIMENVWLIRDIIADSKENIESDDFSTYVTGDAAISADMELSANADLELIEPITIIIIIVLMGLFFRSVVAQFLPLGSVMVALGISQAIVFVVGYLVANIHYSVLTMMFSILMGVGTDYSLFIVARYREERIRGSTREKAVETSVTWAGESITTSGATVIISFFALALASFSMIRTMGLVLGMSICIALLVALTLVPSILMLIGNRIFWPTRGKRWKKYASGVMAKRSEGHRGYFYKAAKFAVRHAKAVIVVALLISIPTTYIFLTAETSFDFIGGMPDVESTDGMNAMTEGFGAGKIMPTQVIVRMDSLIYDGNNFSIEALDAIEDISFELSEFEIVKQVISPTRPLGSTVDYQDLSQIPSEAGEQQKALMLENVGLDNRTALIEVILKEEPMTKKSVDSIKIMREQIQTIGYDNPMVSSAEIYVGGATAIIYDLSLQLDVEFDRMEMTVIIGIFIVLLIVLGSLLLPIFAIISIALSISWSFAATVAIFGYWLQVPIIWILPLILFVMLMGIGMDYNVFILTRIREEVHKGKSDENAIVDALDWTGGIITALAIIMGGAFSVMMLSNMMMLREFGFALAFAIILDAMVVRTYIVPAAMTLLGKWSWWAPGRLQRERRGMKLKRDEFETNPVKKKSLKK